MPEKQKEETMMDHVIQQERSLWKMTKTTPFPLEGPHLHLCEQGGSL